jgi:hypothetical protein
VLKKAFEAAKGDTDEEFSLAHPYVADSVIHYAQEEDAEGAEGIKPTDIVIEYSTQSRQTLRNMVNATFKLLWDGSLSP